MKLMDGGSLLAFTGRRPFHGLVAIVCQGNDTEDGQNTGRHDFLRR